MSKPKTLFDHLRAITTDKDLNYWETLSDSEKKTYNRYMIHRFLSMNYNNIQLIAEFLKYTQELPPDVLYKYMATMIPKDRTFLKYIKGKKQEKYAEWMVTLVKKWYECSMREAYDNVDMMYQTKLGRDNIKKICEAYGSDPKEIQKLFRTYKKLNE